MQKRRKSRLLSSTKGEKNRIELLIALNQKLRESKPRKSRNACIQSVEISSNNYSVSEIIQTFLCLYKLINSSYPSFKSFSQSLNFFFLKIGQNNFGKKIPYTFFEKNICSPYCSRWCCALLIVSKTVIPFHFPILSWHIPYYTTDCLPVCSQYIY